MRESAIPAALPNSSGSKPAPLVECPAKWVQSATALLSPKNTAIGGAKSSSSHTGCVHTCSFDSSVMPNTTRGMMMSDPRA